MINRHIIIVLLIFLTKIGVVKCQIVNDYGIFEYNVDSIIMKEELYYLKKYRFDSSKYALNIIMDKDKSVKKIVARYNGFPVNYDFELNNCSSLSYVSFRIWEIPIGPQIEFYKDFSIKSLYIYPEINVDIGMSEDSIHSIPFFKIYYEPEEMVLSFPYYVYRNLNGERYYFDQSGFLDSIVYFDNDIPALDCFYR